MTNITSPWTEELSDSQDAPRVPILDCMLPQVYAVLRVETLDEVFANYHEGMILCKSEILGFYLVVPL